MNVIKIEKAVAKTSEAAIFPTANTSSISLQSLSILESVLHTQKYDILPNNDIRLYDFLDSSGEVSKALFSNGVTVAEISA